MLQKNRRNILYLLPLFVLIVCSSLLIPFPSTTVAEKIVPKTPIADSHHVQYDRYIYIDLDTDTLTLYDKTTTRTMKLVSQGKPGSYYETIGGIFISDYKIPLHFSSLGHVYMPYSVHLFGNYFIHGIPYYPDGTRVSSSYSGGCVRLHDGDAKIVYDFVTEDTPIIISREGLHTFARTDPLSSSPKITSILMTKLMSTIISLEFLNQETSIALIEKKSVTRLALATALLTGSSSDIRALYQDTMTDDYFLRAMNIRAKTLGLTNTTFISSTSSAITTEEDYSRFISHVLTYKSYLSTITRSTN
jgi:hypothetical protein